MSKETTIVARRNSDGQLVKVFPDGSEQLLQDTTEWAALCALTDEEVMARALADPDAQPLTPQQLSRMRPVPLVKTLRRRLSVTQEEFALRFQIPIGTLRDWEQGRCEPDQPTRAYLRVIASDHEGVERALAKTIGL
jgi:putative transcriptional regulator